MNPRRLAFLDLACISQTDEVLKAASLVSALAFSFKGFRV